MLVTVSQSEFKKHAESIDYIFATREKMFYFYPGNGDDIVFVRVSRKEGDADYSVCFYIFSEQYSNKLTEGDEKAIKKFISEGDDFIGERYYAYDFALGLIIFGITEHKIINNAYWYLHLPDKMEEGDTFLAYYNVLEKNEFIKKLVFITKKPELLAMISGQIMSRFLINPTEITEFGSTICFLAGCIQERVKPKKEDYVKLVEYISKGGKNISDVVNRKLSTKRLEEVMTRYKEKKLKKSTEDKSLVPSKTLTLADIVRGGGFFSVIPTKIEMDDESKRNIPIEILSITLVRGGLHFITSNLDVFREKKSTEIMNFLKDYTNIEDISLGYRGSLEYDD